MSHKHESLKLGKGSAFVKTKLKRLPQEQETWEADFRALPKPPMQSATHYLGMVVTQTDGFLLADAQIVSSPSVNDLATILAHAMRRPMEGAAHRPTKLLLRGHHQWRELFPHLEELRIEVSVERELPTIEQTYSEYLETLRKERRTGMVKPTDEQSKVEQMFPAIAQWVKDGHIEIGDQEGFGFIVRAIDYGGQIFEDDKSETLTEALLSLEAGLRKWFEEQGEPID